jgi:hypothetical protein
VVTTLAANIASADPTWTARLVAITAPVSFLLAVEVLTRTGRRLSTTDDTTTQPQPATTPVVTPPAVATGSTGAARQRPTAAHRVAQAVAKTPDASPAQIAARLGVSERTVQRYWPHAKELAPPSTSNHPPAAGTRGLTVAPVSPTAFDRANEPARPSGNGRTT